MAKWDGSLVEVVVKPSTNYKVTKEVKKLEIHDGYTIEDLESALSNEIAKREDLESKYNDLATKFNALLAAYKANTAKVAMQILDLEENN